jgi:hypothetical protein
MELVSLVSYSYFSHVSKCDTDHSSVVRYIIIVERAIQKQVTKLRILPQSPPSTTSHNEVDFNFKTELNTNKIKTNSQVSRTKASRQKEQH